MSWFDFEKEKKQAQAVPIGTIVAILQVVIPLLIKLWPYVKPYVVKFAKFIFAKIKEMIVSRGNKVEFTVSNSVFDSIDKELDKLQS